ncbi:unnamed protein product [Scytosiphon promiscuus]
MSEALAEGIHHFHHQPTGLRTGLSCRLPPGSAEHSTKRYTSCAAFGLLQVLLFFAPRGGG